MSVFVDSFIPEYLRLSIMQKIKISFLICSLLLLFLNGEAKEEIPAYYKTGIVSGSLTEVKAKVKTALSEKQYKMIGAYHPEGKSLLYVTVFTRKDLQIAGLKNSNRGALINTLRVGFVKKTNGYEVSFVNPEYLFRGYFGKLYITHAASLKPVIDDFIAQMKKISGSLIPFGGKLSTSDLEKYHYMMGMPYFDDPVELKEFDSFETGLATIKKNLAAKKGGCVKVYELNYAKVKIAVFGVALTDKEKGEAHFLPIIGEDHLAAMPYEIILVNNKVTMLHGRFRFALYWPTLTMGTFTKIMSTPGDVEDQLKMLIE